MYSPRLYKYRDSFVLHITTLHAFCSLLLTNTLLVQTHIHDVSAPWPMRIFILFLIPIFILFFIRIFILFLIRKFILFLIRIFILFLIRIFILFLIRKFILFLIRIFCVFWPKKVLKYAFYLKCPPHLSIKPITLIWHNFKSL